MQLCRRRAYRPFFQVLLCPNSFLRSEQREAALFPLRRFGRRATLLCVRALELTPKAKERAAPGLTPIPTQSRYLHQTCAPSAPVEDYYETLRDWNNCNAGAN